jgi:hypothetical protein
MTYMGLTGAVRQGRAAVYWSWYCSVRYGGNNIGNRAYNRESRTFGEYPGWRVMRSQPRMRFGVAGAHPGRSNRKVHIVKDQVVAKHHLYDEQRLTRWLCGTYTFAGILQESADTVCSACLLKAQHRTTEPLP